MKKQDDKPAETSTETSTEPQAKTVHEIEARYDFDYRKAKANRFADRLQQERVMVVLDDDVAAVFPTSEAVNSALRVIAAAIQQLPAPEPASRPRKRPAAAP
jgi:hypothetical protein